MRHFTRRYSSTRKWKPIDIGVDWHLNVAGNWGMGELVFEGLDETEAFELVRSVQNLDSDADG